ncbi:MAG: hypothetical protein A3J94_14455 [Syntrophus sp. RIFOXYC2_FULL_54_9]|nr:MAG: hypothetical protein A2X92_03405 [Syntrophus sp. GWC2_56_31]OHE32392.1 MAG: hypothetical protein A3J94_14455 [Syntrophus sp. RIFOXYC2_FULL_54_9]HBB17311.1 hypothetical protein [Syntrophus sp. (in: bacteria)]
MTILIDTILILLGVVFLLFVGFAIPCILEIRRTAKDMALTLRILNENLPVIMKNLDEITTRINRTSTTMEGYFDDLSLMMKKMRAMMILFVGLEEIIRRKVNLPFVPMLGTVLAVSKGVRVFLSHLLSERSKGG